MGRRNNHWIRNLIVSTLPVLLCASGALGQTDRATLEGTVTDKSGGTINGANVMVTEVKTGIVQERKTNSDGIVAFRVSPSTKTCQRDELKG